MIAVVAQARMSSERLPGKVLRPIAGKPALEYLLERLDRVPGADLVIVATSTDPSDDAIEEYCRRVGARFHRGPLENVAERYLQVVERFDVSAFARVTADSPVLDWRVVERAIELFRRGEFDVVTNVFPSTYPSGQSVEVISRDAFRSAFTKMREPGDLEHVTPFFYRNPELFRIENFSAGNDDAELDMSLDTPEDAAILEAMVSRMDRPHWEYTSEELVGLFRAVKNA